MRTEVHRASPMGSRVDTSADSVAVHVLLDATHGSSDQFIAAVEVDWSNQFVVEHTRSALGGEGIHLFEPAHEVHGDGVGLIERLPVREDTLRDDQLSADHLVVERVVFVAGPPDVVLDTNLVALAVDGHIAYLKVAPVRELLDDGLARGLGQRGAVATHQGVVTLADHAHVGDCTPDDESDGDDPEDDVETSAPDRDMDPVGLVVDGASVLWRVGIHGVLTLPRHPPGRC